MKRNLDQFILQLDGKPFDDNATLKTVLFLAVTGTAPSDQSMTTVDKIKLYSLAQKIHVGGVVELQAEDISLLKDRVGKVFSSVVVIGRTFDLLDADYSE